MSTTQSEASQQSRSIRVSPDEELLAPGVYLTRVQPGGVNGPNNEVQADVIGGLVWQDLWYLGTDDDDFRMCIPDIRMPPNQFWPLHWHDEWVVVVILEGSVLTGDWVMKPGDVLITQPNVEYGPLVIGPHGCQMLEVFCQNSKGGGYAPEYHDHPTLTGKGRVMYRPDIPRYGKTAVFNFTGRPPGSERNEGHSAMKIDDDPRLLKGNLHGGQRWDLGASDDPNRGAMLDTKLAAGETIPRHRLHDWRWSLVLDGDLTLGDRRLTTNDIVVVEPGVDVPEIKAGANGAKLLEFCRTVAGEARRTG